MSSCRSSIEHTVDTGMELFWIAESVMIVDG